MNPQGPVLRLASILLAASFVVKLAVHVFGLGRGLEMGDEGFFLLNLNQPEASPPFFEFYKLLSLVPRPIHFDVVEARGLRLICELVATAVLIAGVFGWAKRRVFDDENVGWLGLAGFALLGALLGVGSRSLSYNDVTNLCAYGAVGLVFAAGASRPGDRGLRLAAGSVAGFLMGFQLAVKFPTALLLVPAAIATVAVGFGGLDRRARIEIVASLCVGVGLAIALFVWANGGLDPLVDKFVRGLDGGRRSGYEPLALLARYVRLELWTALNLAWLAAVFFASRWLLGRRLGADATLAAALGVGALALAWSADRVHPFFLDPTLVFLAAWLPFAWLALWEAHRRARSTLESTPRSTRRGPARGRTLAPLLLLLALPLIEIAGTNVPVSLRIPSHALPWCVGLAVLAGDLRLRAAHDRSFVAVAACLFIATGVLFARHQIAEPYGLARPLVEQRHAVTGLPNVRVDRPTRDFLEQVRRQMSEAGFERGDAIIAFDYMPGLVHYLGGTSPGFPFYSFDRSELNCFYLNAARFERMPFLILGKPLEPAQRACLEAFEFPESFRRIGSLPFPYREVYAGFGAPGLSRIYLYAPRDDAGAVERGQG